MRTLFLAAIALAISTPISAHARDTARQFLARCALIEANPQSIPPNDARFFAGYCIGVIQGVSDGSTYATSFMRGAGKLREKKDIFCIPPDISKGALAKILIDFGTSHPELLEGPDINLITLAFRQRFPCD